jgi:hypothetical protein
MLFSLPTLAQRDSPVPANPGVSENAGSVILRQSVARTVSLPD